jgi:hypothetical protein
VRVARALQELGYAHVTLDLLGYRRGSLNEGVLLQPRGRGGFLEPMKAAGAPATAR